MTVVKVTTHQDHLLKAVQVYIGMVLFGVSVHPVIAWQKGVLGIPILYINMLL